MRGKVQRIQITMKMRVYIFRKNKPTPINEPRTPKDNGRVPIGLCQPPRKSTVAMEQPTTILAYSPIKKRPQLNQAYSVNAPATSSLSASAMSNGARFVSASMQMKKMRNVTGMRILLPR